MKPKDRWAESASTISAAYLQIGTGDFEMVPVQQILDDYGVFVAGVVALEAFNVLIFEDQGVPVTISKVSWTS